MIRRHRRLRTAFVYTALAALSLLFLFPLFWVIGLSLKTRLQMFAVPPLFLWAPTLANYAAVLHTPMFLRALANSVAITAAAVAFSLIVGVPTAYAVARFRFPLRTTLYFGLLVMRMLPPIAVIVPMYILFDAAGLINTRTCVVLAYMTFSLPLVVWIMRGFFEELPRELEESAWTDGASRLAAFRLVVLPLARPGLAACAVLNLLIAWNDFLFAAVLTNGDTRTLPVLMAGFSGDTGINWGDMTASAVLVVTPVLLFAFAAQRHLVAGLSSGSVKG
ncbi:MAG: carbohydrate ABC transporter permease [Acetobacteraceae bacterium]|nr:carbohydrate ABC transporter permease [Acetobacteraceae bacterium]